MHWDPEGKRLAWGSAMDECAVRTWNAQSNDIQSINTPTGSHRMLRWNPAGDKIAVATYRTRGSKVVVMIGRESNDYTIIKTARFEADIIELAWSAAGDKLYILTNEDNVIALDPETLERQQQLPERSIRSIACHPSKSIIALPMSASKFRQPSPRARLN